MIRWHSIGILGIGAIVVTLASCSSTPSTRANDSLHVLKWVKEERDLDANTIRFYLDDIYLGMGPRGMDLVLENLELLKEGSQLV